MKTLLSSYDSVVQWNIMQSLKNNLVKEYTAIGEKMVYAILLQKFLKITIYSEEKKPEMKYIQILTLAFSE